MKIRVDKKTLIVYGILVAIASVSLLFTNISYDVEYQVAMAYRVLKGDVMILEMWEPHQTSAFLCAIFMKIYMTLFGTTTGIILYLQFVGFALRVLCGFLMYKIVRKVSGEVPAIIVFGINLLISPKELVLPEFGNMQLLFGMLLFFMLVYYQEKAKIRYLIGAAIFMCLGVFSYPSFLLVYIAVVIIFIKNSKTPKKDIAIFTGVCALIGGSFVVYLLSIVDWATMMNCLDVALAVEPSHTVSLGDKVLAHILNIGKITLMLAGVAAIGLFIECLIGLVIGKKKHTLIKISYDRWFFISWYVLMICLLCNILSVSHRGGYAFPFIVILILGVCNRKLLSDDEKRLFDMAWLISGMSLIATLVLSDNAFLQAVTYMLISICISIIPIYRYFETKWEQKWIREMCVIGCHIFFVLIIFRCVFIHIPFHGRGQIYSLASDIALVRSGPAIGIIAEEDGVARQRDSMAEWKEYIKPGDTIWILGEPVDTLGYLYEDVEVGAPTVMSTPTYNEQLLYYWELNPEKYPDVVILASSFGELSWELRANEWLMDWVHNEYCADDVIDGNYWRYYIKRNK